MGPQLPREADGLLPAARSQAGDRTAQKIERLLTWLEELKKDLDIPLSIKEAGVNEADFIAKLDELAVEAFDDQCTGANPRYPLITELGDVLSASFYGSKYLETPLEMNVDKEGIVKKTKPENKELVQV